MAVNRMSKKDSWNWGSRDSLHEDTVEGIKPAHPPRDTNDIEQNLKGMDIQQRVKVERNEEKKTENQYISQGNVPLPKTDLKRDQSPGIRLERTRNSTDIIESFVTSLNPFGELSEKKYSQDRSASI